MSDGNPGRRPLSPLTLYLLVVVATLLVLAMLEPRDPALREEAVSYSELKQLVNEGHLDSITLRGLAISARLREPLPLGEPPRPTERVSSRVPALGDPDLLPLLEAREVEIQSLPDESGNAAWLWGLLPWLALFALYFWFLRRMSGNLGGPGGGNVGDFLAGSAKQVSHDVPTVTFEDVAGQDNAKQEVAELVDFLRRPERYREMGAEAPRGILLVGPPGTGKTLLARALAGEAGVAFFNTSASEFIEMFAGAGASRVRKMFQEAKQRAPSIIFIDELDSVGRMRGAGLGGGHDEREQTLNQILAEMDGFSGHQAVIVLAATNRPDVLDPALLRPGRFDRHVTLELPDKAARQAILQVHCRHLKLHRAVNLEQVAAGTPGFSGADLKNLVNEAAICAARERSPRITMAQLEATRDKVMMGSVRTLAIQPEERHRLAVHEAGHTLVASFLPNADPLHKVTIIPRGQALGGTHLLPEAERHTLPEEYLHDQLAMLLGGRVAEKLLLGSVSSGADDDIHRATGLARAMVARWGMAEDIGPVDLRDADEHPFLGREIAQPRHFSDTTAHEVDQAVAALLHDAGERAGALIRQHRAGMDALVAALEARETLERAEIEALLAGAAKPREAAVAG